MPRFEGIDPRGMEARPPPQAITTEVIVHLGAITALVLPN
jgi:hypothetical protein